MLFFFASEDRAFRALIVRYKQLSVFVLSEFVSVLISKIKFGETIILL